MTGSGGTPMHNVRKHGRFRRLFALIRALLDIRVLLIVSALVLFFFEGRMPRMDVLDQGLFQAGLYLKAVPVGQTEPLIITLPPETMRAITHEPDALTDLFSLLLKLRQAGPSALALILEESPALTTNGSVAAIGEKISRSLETAAPDETNTLKNLLAFTQSVVFRGKALADSLDQAGVIVGITHLASVGVTMETAGAYGQDRALPVAPPRVATYRDKLPTSALPSRMPELIPSSETPVWQGRMAPLRSGGGRTDWPLIWKEKDRYLPDLVTLMVGRSLKTQPTWEMESGVMFGFTFVNTDPAGFVKPRFAESGKFKTNLDHRTVQDLLSARNLDFVKKRPVFIGSAENPALTGAALAYLSLNSGAVSHVPWQATWLGKALILIILIYLLALTPLVRPATGLIVSLALSAGLILFQMGVHLISDQFLPLGLPLVFLAAGHALMLIRRQIRSRLSELDAAAQSALFELGHFQYEQSRFDQAFASLKQCRADERVLEILYKLGVSLERKRQFDKASSVFAYITDQRPGYRDARERSDQLAQLLFGRTSTGPGLSAPVTSLSRSVLGRYEIERELGRGAMGVVYLGKDPKINRSIAIKTMDFTQTFEGRFDEVKDRFFREAMAAGRLTHPNIVTIFDAGEEQDLAYIAMDYVEGKPLNEFNRPETLLPVTVVFRIMAQVAEALDYAHKQQIIHRDIKPGNIIYNPMNHTIKVTDFGIARIADVSTTRTGVVVGSPSFMAPEQLKGQEIDGRADIFSLGVTFYQLLTGTLPFKGTDLASLGYQITSVKHAPVSSHRGDLPKIADSIIDKALQKNPASRYKTAGGMARSLLTGLKGDTLL